MATKPNINIINSNASSDTLGMSGMGMCFGGIMGVNAGPSSWDWFDLGRNLYCNSNKFYISKNKTHF